MNLSEKLTHTINTDTTPLLLNLSKKEDQKQLEQLFEKSLIAQVVDTYEDQLTELVEIRNPEKAFLENFTEIVQQFIQERSESLPLWQQGNWAYYSWSQTLVHILEDDEFQECRFNRNHNFITREEQKIFYNSTIGIAGLSVGNSVALNLAIEGGAKTIKLADFDELSITNLNRIRTGVHSLGTAKTTICARQIYELNPYAQVIIFDKGMQEETIDEFYDSPKLDIVIDELDNLGMKVLMREKAKEKKIPLIMATDNGDDGIVDIERHDLEDTEFFGGRIGQISYKDLLHLSKFEIGKYASQIIGPENVHSKMLGSLDQLGKTLVSWPQLGGAALLNGAAVAYTARKILTNAPLINGRAMVSLDAILTPKSALEEELKKRQELISKMPKPE
jgi:molybdopterin/thiamine biosynthesis adenylyltransferase